MPRLVNHFHLVKQRRYYDPVELAMLQGAYDGACQSLNIDQADQPRRERLASLIFTLAEQTSDPQKILKRAVLLFRGPEPPA